MKVINLGPVVAGFGCLLLAFLLTIAESAALSSAGARLDRAERLALLEMDYPWAMGIIGQVISTPGLERPLLVRAHLLKGAIRYLGKDQGAARLSFTAALELDPGASMSETTFNSQVRAFFESVKQSRVSKTTRIPKPSASGDHEATGPLAERIRRRLGSATEVPLNPVPLLKKLEDPAERDERQDEERLRAAIDDLEKRGDWPKNLAGQRRIRIGQVPLPLPVGDENLLRIARHWQAQLYVWVDDALKKAVADGLLLVIAAPLKSGSAALKPGGERSEVDAFYARYEQEYAVFLHRFGDDQHVDLLLLWDQLEEGETTIQIEFMVYDLFNNAVYPGFVELDGHNRMSEKEREALEKAIREVVAEATVVIMGQGRGSAW